VRSRCQTRPCPCLLGSDVNSREPMMTECTRGCDVRYESNQSWWSHILSFGIFRMIVNSVLLLVVRRDLRAYFCFVLDGSRHTATRACLSPLSCPPPPSAWVLPTFSAIIVYYVHVSSIRRKRSRKRFCVNSLLSSIHHPMGRRSVERKIGLSALGKWAKIAPVSNPFTANNAVRPYRLDIS
jgi:hypothetical protein